MFHETILFSYCLYTITCFEINTKLLAIKCAKDNIKRTRTFSPTDPLYSNKSLKFERIIQYFKITLGMDVMPHVDSFLSERPDSGDIKII